MVRAGTCGGCKQQDLDYTTQTKFKQQQVEEVFKKMGGFKDFVIANAAGVLIAGVLVTIFSLTGEAGANHVFLKQI